MAGIGKKSHPFFDVWWSGEIFGSWEPGKAFEKSEDIEFIEVSEFVFWNPKVAQNSTTFSMFSSDPGMLTLYLSITGGLSWEEALRPLQKVNPLAVISMLARSPELVYT